MLDRTINVAPMMGCTDRHCRYLLRLISPRSLIYSEMVTTGALLHGDPDRFLQHYADEPVALQLGGNDPAALATCARLGEAAGYQEVNLNVGCPSDRVQQGGIGACLMAEPDLVAECITRMQAVTSIPVTVKSRIGLNQDESYESFARFVSIVRDGGCRVFIVHARNAILGGLSPKENREIPPLRYDYVYQIRQDFPDCVFVLNGGLRQIDEVDEVLAEGLAGVMLGRAIYSDPFLLGRIEAHLFGSDVPDRQNVLACYMDYMEERLRQGVAFKHMARHLLGVFTGQPGARAFRRHLSAHMFRDDANCDVISQALTVSGLGIQTDQHAQAATGASR